MSDEQEKSTHDLLAEALKEVRSDFFTDSPDLETIEKEFTKLQWEIVYSRIVIGTLRTLSLAELRKKLDLTTELPLFHGNMQLALRGALEGAGASPEEIEHFLYGEIEDNDYDYRYMMLCRNLAEAFDQFQTDVSNIRSEISQKESEEFQDRLLTMMAEYAAEGSDKDDFN